MTTATAYVYAEFISASGSRWERVTPAEAQALALPEHIITGSAESAYWEGRHDLDTRFADRRGRGVIIYDTLADAEAAGYEA